MNYPLSTFTWNDSRTENTCSLDKRNSSLQHLSIRLLKNLERHINIIFLEEIFILMQERITSLRIKYAINATKKATSKACVKVRY